MASLNSLLLEITWNEYNKAVSGDKYKPLTSEERASIRQQMLDPNTSEETKNKLKNRVIGSYMQLLPTWYNELGARNNGVPVDDFIGYASEAMIRASKGFDWTKPNEYGAYARMAIRNATINYGKDISKRKQVSLDKPVGSDKEGGVLTIGDVLPGEQANQQRIDDMMDNDVFQKRLKDLSNGIKNQTHKYVLRWTTDPRYQTLTANEIANIIGELTGKTPTIQGINGIRAKFRNEILPKLMKGLE